MTMPKDLPGQVKHVLSPCPLRDVLVSIAERVEALSPSSPDASEPLVVAEPAEPVTAEEIDLLVDEDVNG